MSSMFSAHPTRRTQLAWLVVALLATSGIVLATDGVAADSYWSQWSNPPVLLALAGFIYTLGVNGQKMKQVTEQMNKFEEKLEDVYVAVNPPKRKKH